MIYNLVQYVINNLSSLNIIANGFDPDSNSDQIMINVTGGEPQHFYNRTDWTVQILSRSKNVTTAKKQIEQVYNLLKNKFAIVLPQVIVDGVTYPTITAWQISPIQAPGYLGANQESIEMFSFNSIVTTS
jgi:hypothetical protein